MMERSYRFWRNTQIAVALALAAMLGWRIYSGNEGFEATSVLLIVLIAVSYAAGQARKREGERND